MPVYRGKIFNYTLRSAVENYSDIQLDVLWYLMDLTNVNRCITKESLREFLIRYLLITHTDLDQTALDFIDHGILIDGYIKERYFCFTVKDLINLIGFSSGDNKYNIEGSLDQFIQNYKYRAPNIKFEPSETEENTVHISRGYLTYALMGLNNLLEIDSFTISFKKILNEVTEENIKRVIIFADYVINNIDPDIFKKYRQSFPNIDEIFSERLLKENVIRFDVYRDIERKKLIEIYKYLLKNDQLQCFIEKGTSDADLISDLKYYNTHILFAYGIKHNYIIRSEDRSSLINCISYSDLEIEFDDLLGTDCEMFTTQEIYDAWKMEKWIDLLP